MNVTQAYVVGIPIIALLIAVEVVVSVVRRQKLYTAADTLGSYGLLAGNAAMGLATKGLAVGAYFGAYAFRPWTLSELMPPWAHWMLAFVLVDLVFYVWHRLSHRTNALWAIHMNHHSSEEMNFVVAFRQPWLAPLFKIPFFAVLPLLGLDPTVLLVAGTISTLWGVTGHTRIVPKLGPLEWIFNTPSHHRVHHGANPRYIDKNYGNLLIVWDRMFGTFEAEDEPVVYGLTHNLGTNDPWKITWHDWKKIASGLHRAQSPRDAFRVLFGPPEAQSAELDLAGAAGRGAEAGLADLGAR
jgi:sterol desaturase/sphingolipid hydroxylase (fatty acid hydroxylase superfamily)